MKKQKIRFCFFREIHLAAKYKNIAIVVSTTIKRSREFNKWLISEKKRILGQLTVIEYSGLYVDQKKAKKIFSKCTQLDLLIAIGGGAVMDLAKHYVYFNLPIKNKQFQLWTIPTTAGTGSEATFFATSYVNMKKESIQDKSLLPDRVFFCSEFLKTVPLQTRIASATDCFCQAIESYLSNRANSESKKYSVKSLKILKSFMVSYIKKPNLKNSKKMQLAAYLSGQAICIARTNLPHALSYELTSKHKIPHGIAVVLNLFPFLQYNQIFSENKDTQKLLKKIYKIWNTNSFQEFRIKIISEFKKLPLDLKIKSYGLDLKKMKKIYSRAVYNPRAQNNPNPIDYEKLVEVLQSNINEIGSM